MIFVAIAYERRLARLVKELERRDEYIARGNELLNLSQESIRMGETMIDDLKAELERVKAERDATYTAMAQTIAEREARLDKALSALREINSLPDQTDRYSVFDTAVSIAHDAITEITGVEV